MRNVDDPRLSSEPRSIPRDRLATEEVDPDLAYQIVHDELMLDGNARLNLATFVGTWAEPNVDRLMADCTYKNMIDKDEYPRTADLEQRCVHILADLWNAPDPGTAPGCSTTGSSEAGMLAGLALKRRWRARNPAGGTPNIVMGGNVQVCWEKFANYFEVEARLVPMAGDRFHLDAASALDRCDENTIGVVAVLGSTFDGSYEPVAAICSALDDLAARGGPDIPVHVDGASGAMIAPFLDPELTWDFRLGRVASINTSGHEYGLTPPGVGWVLWRDRDALPDELVYTVNYLGADMATFALNFSRPGAQVVVQYYQFLRLGRDGFAKVAGHSRSVATRLARGVAALGPFELLTDGSQLPVFAVRLHDDVSGYNVFDVSAGLRENGWQVPAYTFPADRTDLAVLRFVVRAGFTHDLAELLLADLRRVVERLAEQKDSIRDAERDSSFAHTGK